MNRLTTKDIIALGFMAFALFVGAGNIIFPPMVGLESGQHLWSASIGFLITAVGLPMITLVALARVGGGIDALSKPIGKHAGFLLAAICYLAVGPFFAIPRTTTVSFKLGFAPLFGETPILPLLNNLSLNNPSLGNAGLTDLVNHPVIVSLMQGASVELLIYSLVYFALVILISLYPGKLLDSVGHFLAPVKILSLTILGITAILWPAGKSIQATDKYLDLPFSTGFVSGYLTMDTLGAMVFGIIIVNAARSRGVREPRLLTRYAIIAGLIAGLGLTLVYISLFLLGAGSGTLVPHAKDGADILGAYIHFAYGRSGSFFLAVMILVACMVTAIGLTCACAEFFSKYLPMSYRSLVFIIAIFSAFVSNLGLSHLIAISVPVLEAIYPPCIALIVLNFTLKWWHSAYRVVAPTVFVCFMMAVVSVLKEIFKIEVEWLSYPATVMIWLPTLITLFIAGILDRILPKPKVQVQIVG